MTKWFLNSKRASYKVLVLILVALAMCSSAMASNANPAFNSKNLDGWHALGSAKWSAQRGEMVGRVQSDGAPGWIVLDESYQNIGLQLWFRVDSGMGTGILLGMNAEGSQKTGTYLSLAQGDLGVYRLVVDSEGKEISRNPVPEPAATRGGWGGRGAAAADGRRPFQNLSGPEGHPLSTPRVPSVTADSWNHLELHIVANSLDVYLNGFPLSTGMSESSEGWQSLTHRYGPIALKVAGKAGGEVRFKSVLVADLTEIALPEEKISSGFRVQKLTSFHFGEGIAVGDLNRDGHVDFIAGPMYYLGPDFKVAREIEEARPFDPTYYKVRQTLGMVVHDFTGDGWLDVLMTHWQAGHPGTLYVNPRNEHRRWDRHEVIPAVMAEIFMLADMDGDGSPEFVYGADGYVNYAKPDPSTPTKPWIVRSLTEQGPWGNRNAHGLGVGDITGDGRLDVMTTWGWWENPGPDHQGPWTYHPEVFGRRGSQPGNPGGAQMHAYDVNADGLADVITSLEGHGRGLAWFQQKRDTSGKISFERHMIMDIDPAQSHGVVFTEMHSVNLVDMDGDGLKDILTGKNKFNWVHYSHGYSDPEGDGVLYWFKLVRKPGGVVDFIPNLIYNQAGMGRQIQAVDLNGDGLLDIPTNGRHGAFILFGKKSSTN